MDFAWLAAALVLILLAAVGLGSDRRARDPDDPQSPEHEPWFDLAWLPAALLMVGALFSVPSTLPLARFTLEELRFPVDPGGELLRLAAPGLEAPEGTPILRTEGLSKLDGVIGLQVTPAAQGKKGTVHLTVPPDSRALIGLDVPDANRSTADRYLGDLPPQIREPLGLSASDSFPHARLVPLDTVSKLTICPGGVVCAEHPLKVDWANRTVGPCDLTREARKERTIALLDLYHYDPDTCIPKRIDPKSTFWPSTPDTGGNRQVLSSFLLLQGTEGWLVNLDGDQLLEVHKRTGPPAVGPRLDLTDVPEAIVDVLRPTISVRVAALEVERYDPDQRLCETGYAGDPTTWVPDLWTRVRIVVRDRALHIRDRSGKDLCKRVRVTYRRHRYHLDLQQSDIATLSPEGSAPVISVPPDCEDGSPCGHHNVRGAYLSSVDSGMSDAARLQFPLALDDGEPLVAEFGFSDDPEVCGEQGPPCSTMTSRRGTHVGPLQQRLILGEPDGEQHLLRVALLETPWWLALVGIGMLVAQSILLPIAAGPAQVLVSFVSLLLGARALYGFKIMARYPHDEEGLITAIVGLALVPMALRLAARPVLGSGVGACIRVLASGLLAGLTLGMLSWSGTLPPFGRLFGVEVAGGMVALFVAAAFYRRGGNQGPSSTAAVVAAGALGAVACGRLGLALLGVERVGPAPLILLYLPIVVVLVGVVFTPATRLRSGVRKALVVGGLLLGVPGVQAPLSGDTGAAMVLMPAMVLAVAVVWPFDPEKEGWRPTGVLAGLTLLSVLGVLLLGQIADRWALPPVARERVVWTPSAQGTGYMCPQPTDVEDGPLDLEDYSRALDLDRWGTRFADYVVTGGANRLGTRTGVEVHEFMSVMRRYASGPEGSPGASGYMAADIRRYGASEVNAQLFDGVPSVLVASEGGSGGLAGLLLACFTALAAVVVHVARRAVLGRPGPAIVAVLGVSIPVWTTFLMVGGNLGLLPFTGQSTPLLAVRSGTDLILTPLLIVLAIGALRPASHKEAT